MLDFEVERSTRQCAATGRTLVEGEEYFSVLMRKGAKVERSDFSLASWSGPPEGALAWWKAKIPPNESKKPKLAPSEVLLQLFLDLAPIDEQRDLRYVLALLMIRRRILRIEETITDERGGEVLRLYCPRDESEHRVPIVLPDPARVEQIQAELSRLLYSGEGTPSAG